MERERSGRCVLVADDEDLVRWSLRERLWNEGYQVVAVESGREAVAASPSADVAVLDWRLPDIDGLEVARAIRLARPSCPVIFMTAYLTPELEEQAARAAVRRVLAKPFDLDDLVRAVRETLERAGSVRGAS